MISLETTKKERAELSPTKPEGPDYPYWSRLDFSPELTKKLKLDGVKAGTECVVTLRGTIERTEHSDKADGKEEHRVCFQAKEIEAAPPKKTKAEVDADHRAKNVY